MIHRLSRVLNAIANYDTELGYVQGMNFLVGALLIHWEECIAFWLVIDLFESYDMRQNYEEGLIGMYRHSQILEKLLKKHLPEVSQHFEDCDIKTEMFMSDWVISFLCSYIPLHRIADFFTRFFERGWPAFHSMVISILHYLKRKILDWEDMLETLNAIKSMKEHRNSFTWKQSSSKQNNRRNRRFDEQKPFRFEGKRYFNNKFFRFKSPS